MMRTTAPLFLLLLLSGCSGKPVLQSEGADMNLQPTVIADGGNQYIGKRVLWGGTIVGSTNLEGRSRLEILSYPLDSEFRPQTDSKAGGRFLAYHKGYLETVDYAAGRQVSLVGTVNMIEEGRLGEHRYRYPSVDVEQLHLWPQPGEEPKSRLHFGIGVMFRN